LKKYEYLESQSRKAYCAN